MLKKSERAENEPRIYIAGEKEYEAEEKNRENLTLQNKVYKILNELGEEFKLKLSEVTE